MNDTKKDKNLFFDKDATPEELRPNSVQASILLDLCDWQDRSEGSLNIYKKKRLKTGW